MFWYDEILGYHIKWSDGEMHRRCSLLRVVDICSWHKSWSSTLKLSSCGQWSMRLPHHAYHRTLICRAVSTMPMKPRQAKIYKRYKNTFPMKSSMSVIKCMTRDANQHVRATRGIGVRGNKYKTYFDELRLFPKVSMLKLSTADEINGKFI